MNLLTTRPNPQLAPLAEFDSPDQYWQYILREQEKVDKRERIKNLIIGWAFVVSVCAIPSVVAYLIFVRVVH